MKTLGAVYGTVALALLAFSPGAMAAARADYALPSLATQEALRDGTLERRIEQLLPSLMRRAGIDVWLLIAREYNDDPVLQTFLPARWPTARRSCATPRCACSSTARPSRDATSPTR